LPQILIYYVMWNFFGLFYSNVGNSKFLGEICTTLQCTFLWRCDNNEALSSWSPQVICGSYCGFQWWCFSGISWVNGTNHDDICIKWITNLNIGIDHLGFEFNGQHVWAKHKNMETRFSAFVTWPLDLFCCCHWGEATSFNCY
jgi:hypothetical protein